MQCRRICADVFLASVASGTPFALSFPGVVASKRRAAMKPRTLCGMVCVARPAIDHVRTEENKPATYCDLWRQTSNVRNISAHSTLKSTVHKVMYATV